MALSIQINVSLSLPRDELTVAVVRHVCRFALREVGATESTVDDMELALTEACTNVLEHSAVDDEYEVNIGINERVCVIRVRDAGRGFDVATVGDQRPELSAESGRGIGLMNALVDKVAFTSVPETGVVVHLEKELAFDDDAPIRRRAAADGAEPGGGQPSSTRR